MALCTYVMLFVGFHLHSMDAWLKSVYLPSRHYVDTLILILQEAPLVKLVERPTSGVQGSTLRATSSYQDSGDRGLHLRIVEFI